MDVDRLSALFNVEFFRELYRSPAALRAVLGSDACGGRGDPRDAVRGRAVFNSSRVRFLEL